MGWYLRRSLDQPPVQNRNSSEVRPSCSRFFQSSFENFQGWFNISRHPLHCLCCCLLSHHHTLLWRALFLLVHSFSMPRSLWEAALSSSTVTNTSFQYPPICCHLQTSIQTSANIYSVTSSISLKMMLNRRGPNMLVTGLNPLTSMPQAWWSNVARYCPILVYSDIGGNDVLKTRWIP